MRARGVLVIAPETDFFAGMARVGHVVLNMYPTPRTVLIEACTPVPAKSLERSRLINPSMLRSYEAQFGPRTLSMISSRLNTLLVRLARTRSTSNSRVDREISEPCGSYTVRALAFM